MNDHGPSQLELLKQVARILNSPVEYLDFAAHAYGDQVHFKAGSVNAYFLNHPDAIQHVLRDRHQDYDKDTIQYKALARVTGRGLLTNSGEHWLKQRRLIQPAFARQKLARIEPFANAAAESAIQRWRRLDENTPVDLEHEMLVISLEVLGLALFGADLGKQVHVLVDAVLVALEHIMAGAKNPLQPPAFLPTHANRKFKQAILTLDEAAKAMLEGRRTAGLGDDLLSMLISAQETQGKKELPDRQIRDEIVTLLIAGHETVATALTWTWYLLAKNPAEYDRMLNEVDTILNGRAPEMADLEALSFCGQVFQEALRLYPPAWLITRRAKSADQVNGMSIPANSLVIISPYTMHRNEQFWQQPDVFDPGRFEEAAIKQQHRFAYIPFGGGPALCIGKNFALTEAVILIARLSQAFRFERCSEEPIKMDALVTLRPVGGLPVRLIPR